MFCPSPKGLHIDYFYFTNCSEFILIRLSTTFINISYHPKTSLDESCCVRAGFSVWDEIWVQRWEENLKRKIGKLSRNSVVRNLSNSLNSFSFRFRYFCVVHDEKSVLWSFWKVRHQKHFSEQEKIDEISSVAKTRIC